MDALKAKIPNNTLVLAITTHGAVPFRDEDAQSIKTFIVPEGMRITKISVAPIGICNMASEDDSARMVSVLKNEFKDNTVSVEEHVKRVIPKLKQLQSGIVTNVVKNKSGQPKNQLTDEFVAYSDRALTVVDYPAGSEMINKVYVKYVGEGYEHPYDFKMPMLNINFPGSDDLLQWLVAGRGGLQTRSMGLDREQYTTLSYIAGFLNLQAGVNHLVLFDYSCSSYYEDIDPRTGRLVARIAKKEGKNGGKKTRRLKRKTKTRRGKKRTTQWKH